MTKIIRLSLTALALSTAAALAQAPGETCKPLDETTCKAASACRWTAPKELSLPNGKPVAIPGVCRFKPGVASAIKAAATAAK